MIAGIHSHLSEEILHIGHDYGQCAQTIPQIIQRKQTFTVCTRRLILQRNERTSQLNGRRKIVLQKFIRKVKHMGSCQNRGTMFVKTHIRTQDITVSTQNFFSFRIPDNQLLVRIVHDVIFVNIHRLARSSSRSAERNLAQTADLLHGIRRVLGSNDIYLVMTSIGHTQALLLSQLRFQQLLAYRCNYIFHISLLVVLLLYKYGLSTIYIQYPSHIAPIQPGFSIYRKFARG